MTTPLDPERIAALIDGRLDARAREQLLLELDGSPEGREILADAAHLIQETTAPLVISKPRTFRQLKAPMAIAAGIAIAAVGLTTWLRDSLSLATPREIAASLGASADRTGSASALWPLTRSGGSLATPTGIAVRVGALAVDLETSAVEDTSAARIALNIATLLESLPAGGPAARAFRAIDPSTTAQARQEAVRRAELVAGESQVRVGAWLEAARLASESHDSAFVAALPVRFTRQIKKLMRGWGASTSDVAAFETAIRRDPVDWVTARDAVTRLLHDLGR